MFNNILTDAFILPVKNIHLLCQYSEKNSIILFSFIDVI